MTPPVRRTIYDPTIQFSRTGNGVNVSRWKANGAGSHWTRSTAEKDRAELHKMLDEFLDRGSEDA